MKNVSRGSRHKIGVLLVVTLCLIMTACTGIRLFGLSSNYQKLRAQILSLVPLGTTVSAAEKRMRRNGFSCKTVHLIAFRDYTARGQFNMFSNVDCLECRGRRIVPLISDRFWAIAFAYDTNQVITNVMVQTGVNAL